MLEGENEYRSAKQLSLNCFVTLQWAVTETLVSNWSAESLSGTLNVRKYCFSINTFDIS